MFIAALFSIAKTWKQPKCPSTEEWIKKMWYIYTMEYYSAIKKNKIMPFASTWMELETLTINEVKQKEKDKYHMISLISGIQYTAQIKLSIEKNLWTWRTDLWLPDGREWEGLGAWGYQTQLRITLQGDPAEQN